MNNDFLRVTVEMSDAERKIMGKRLRKYRPKAVRQRFWRVGAIVWLLTCVLMGIFFYCLPRGMDGLYGVCSVYAEDWEACAALLEEGVRLLRFAFYSLIGAFVLLAWHLVWIYESQWRANFRPLNGREFVYDISAEGFTSHEFGVSRTHYTWTGVVCVVRDERYLLVFVDQGAAFGIPWRAFADPAQGEAFAAQAQTWHAAATEKANEQLFS